MATTSTQTQIRPNRNFLRASLAGISKYGTIGGLIILVIAFSIALPYQFPTLRNVTNIFSQVSLTAIIAGGVTIPLVVGEFDMSIGYQASFAGVLVTGLMVNQHVPAPVAIIVVLVVGALFGLINGLIVTKFAVNAFVATLGTGTVIVGLNYGYSAGTPITAGLPNMFLNLGLGTVAGIPITILVMILVLVLLWILLNRTDLGQSIQAVGGNVEASRLSGIRVDRIKILAFVLSGICASLTGILLAARLGSGEPTAGDGYLLDAFAAVFLGSAALRDGEFHIIGTFIGVLLVGVAFNGLGIIGAPTFYQYVFQGALLVIAVAMSSVARKYLKR
jgi:ribose transport system permease protein